MALDFEAIDTNCNVDTIEASGSACNLQEYCDKSVECEEGQALLTQAISSGQCVRSVTEANCCWIK